MLTLNGLSSESKGVPLIVVEADINADGILDVSARDLVSGKEEKITITNPLPFSYKAEVTKEKAIALLNEEEIEGEIGPLWISSSKEADVWNNRGVALLRSGKYKDAIECFNRAIGIESNFKRAKENKKIAEEKLKEKTKDDALKALKYAYISLEKAKELGINTKSEEDKLYNAKRKLDEKDFLNATKLAKECRNSLDEKINEYKKLVRQSLDFAYSKIKEAEKLGINVSNAQDLHKKAISAFDRREYGIAIEYAEKCKKAAEDEIGRYNHAKEQIDASKEIVETTKRFVAIPKAEELIKNAEAALEIGNYNSAFKFAKEAEGEALKFR
jgi:tetratricopeptide (TPR) repeat protein